MTMSKESNHDLLLRSASTLMRQKGYSGVGLNEILAAAKLPKGSLYYHFPRGKPELAAAATVWAGEMVTTMIDQCFLSAESFPEGAANICRAVADLSIRKGRVSACPVMSVLPAALDEPLLREAARSVYHNWTTCAAQHAARFGIADPDETALDLHMRLQGAWVLAFAEQSVEPFQILARRIQPD